MFFASPAVWASSTGLNNIPTTDVVPKDILVFQTWINSTANQQTQLFTAFKYGPFEDIEVGVDWKANDKAHGHAMLQAKYAFDIDDFWRGVVGFADLSDNRVHNGEFFPFAATSYDLNIFRLHFGYAPQPHNEAFFAGIDKTVLFMERNLQLKADAIHINDKDDAKFSVGFLYEFAPANGSDQNSQSFLENILKNIILESWVTIPTTDDIETYTVKLNYVIKF